MEKPLGFSILATRGQRFRMGRKKRSLWSFYRVWPCPVQLHSALLSLGPELPPISSQPDNTHSLASSSWPQLLGLTWAAHVSVNHTEGERGVGDVQRDRRLQGPIAYGLAEPQTVSSGGKLKRHCQRSEGERKELPGRTVKRKQLYGFGEG